MAREIRRPIIRTVTRRYGSPAAFLETQCDWLTFPRVAEELGLPLDLLRKRLRGKAAADLRSRFGQAGAYRLVHRDQLPELRSFLADDVARFDALRTVAAAIATAPPTPDEQE
jgi:hypothetical protein